ncbi:MULTISPECIES: hypothetical protein [Vibrio]|uniref:hypothetical protein n=1 Tax=Vibrio TaxID=662 RepID=UPI0020755018|nr:MULTISPECIES: hypothetical protein [Vibrio]USD35454.1 hypothetical protein J8Z27_22810 [Vibrio sp. SCSIO 43186]USD72578.1 hypothetical protein J4N41_22815 [Vibrio sp. SCSIO 43139]USD98971.1 hypothetical protein CTT30_23135 [Vibrio coralliilyticus]
MDKELTFSLTIAYETDTEDQIICESSLKENLATAIENQRVNGALTPDDISATKVVIEMVEDDKRCHECGLKFEIDSGGIAKHFDDYGDHDWVADGDHVPYAIES